MRTALGEWGMKVFAFDSFAVEVFDSVLAAI
jgi:hypothetical protein